MMDQKQNLRENTDFRETGLFHVGRKTYNISEIFFNDVALLYHTGYDVVTDIPRGRIHAYRKGCATRIGDIQIDDWIDIVKYLIDRDQEQDLYLDLIEFMSRHEFGRNRSDFEVYTLSLHADRIFDNPNWIYYAEFNAKYRPDILKGEKQ